MCYFTAKDYEWKQLSKKFLFSASRPPPCTNHTHRQPHYTSHTRTRTCTHVNTHASTHHIAWRTESDLFGRQMTRRIFCVFSFKNFICQKIIWLNAVPAFHCTQYNISLHAVQHFIARSTHFIARSTTFHCTQNNIHASLLNCRCVSRDCTTSNDFPFSCCVTGSAYIVL